MLKISSIGVVLLLLVGCSQVITPNAPEATGLALSTNARVPETQIIHTSPTDGDATQMVEPLPTSSKPGLQVLIEKTKEDLAQRLSVPITQITLNEATEAEWSDSSLGCPRPGMDYLQVITPGYLIRLEVNTQIYEYHSNRDTYFVYCENSSPSIFPKP